ncbi:hypothetical protein Tco_0726473 [Tanacetum coccineum]|uniref:Uncharacterized protein n=1 Tax=Tanacetum coccineum TaxID=301880 RepID=A0ABQ4YGK4_9ASTR
MLFPPPLTGLFAPPSVDLSSLGIEKFKEPEFEGYGVKVTKSASENVSKEVKKTSDAPIIEDWVSDCDEDETVVLESLNVQKPKQADQPRKISQNPRNNSTSWNTPKPKKLGVGFQFTPKACFVCGILKNRNLSNQVNTANVISVNTVEKQGINAVKPTAYWGSQNSPYFMVKSWLVQEQTVLVIGLFQGNRQLRKRESSNPFMVNVTILEDAFKKTHTQTLTLFDKDSQKIRKQAQITRADGTSSFHGDFQALLRRLDRQDLFQLYSLVQEIYKHRSIEGHDLDLWGDLKMMFDPNEEDDICLVQERYKHRSIEGHDLDLWGDLKMMFDPNKEDDIWLNQHYWELLRTKSYPLKKEILKKMINLKIEAEEESDMASELITVNHKFRGGLLGIKELLQDMLLKNLVPTKDPFKWNHQPPLPPSLYIPPPVDRKDDVPESELPPRKRLCLSTLGSRYKIGESSTARPTRGRGVDYGFVSIVDAEARWQGISKVGVTELTELHEYDTQDLYALLEDAQDGDSMDCGGGGLCFPRGLGSLDRIESGDLLGASDPP